MALVITKIHPLNSTEFIDFTGRANATDTIQWDFYTITPAEYNQENLSIIDKEFEVYIYDTDSKTSGRKLGVTLDSEMSLSGYGFPAYGGKYYVEIHEFYNTISGAPLESIPIISNLNQIIINNINDPDNDVVTFTITPNTTTQSPPQYVQLTWNINSAKEINSIKITNDINALNPSIDITYYGSAGYNVTENITFTLNVVLKDDVEIIKTASFTFNEKSDEGAHFNIDLVTLGDRIAKLDVLYYIWYTPTKITKIDLYFIYKDNNIDTRILANSISITSDMYDTLQRVSVAAKYLSGQSLEAGYGVSGSFGYIITNEDGDVYPLKIVETFKLINPP